MRRAARAPHVATAALAAAAVLLAPAGPAAAGAADLADSPAGPASSRQVPAGPAAEVVVAGVPGAADRVRAAVLRAGGTPTRDLPIVDGVAARVPRGALPALLADPAVRGAAPDATMHVEETGRTGLTGRPSAYHHEIRADDARAAGATGAGVAVALLDTGVDTTTDLAGRVRSVQDDLSGESAPCVDLSGEGHCRDTYGHGTFLAGLIAGTGRASGGRHAGVAPAADIVSIKVAGADGSSDVSTVLAGIQWAVSFRDRYDIRVLNLSLGTDSTQSWRVDPLNYAVERAWHAGIVVVVSASNLGPTPGSITKPADDPWVVTVGAVDDRGTPAVDDDLLPAFSGRGPTREGVAKPDLVAPGAHLVSLDATDSTLAARFPSDLPAPYRRGSGTSMAAAVVSGAVAQMLSVRPDLTPDRVKFLLTATARRVASDAPADVGAGLLDVHAATTSTLPGSANAGLERSNGTGSLDASRGSVRVHVDGPVPTVLRGVQTAQLLVWDPLGTTLGLWTAPTWYVTPWYLARWWPTTWHGGFNWEGFNWEGATWYGQPEDTWYGDADETAAWYGAWA